MVGVRARILAAPDPARPREKWCDLLDADRTGNRLAAALPLLDENQVVASVGWPRAVDEAMAERQDLPARRGARRRRSTRSRRCGGGETERSVRVVEQWDAVLDDVAYLLVPAAAIGPTTALVPAGVGALLDRLRELVDAKCGSSAASAASCRPGCSTRRSPRASHPGERHDVDDAVPETCSLERFDRLAGPRGVESPVDAAARFDCPVVPELLRPLS